MTILVIILSMLISLLVFISREYIRGNTRKTERQKEIIDLQLMVKENRSVFGRENEGTSMDNKEIYAISPKEIGL